ncbi:restriction endonuclease subunit S [Mesomycoplasma neurolyticum]|uniref:Restriction modification enzyme subunit S2B n=1 Tax=Mesomycoplasma neurolyticum TaxID=2120 RepID=A0A449A4F5_9BACT|nr:restriction endonuclease subunit S [Mesomycoplasma neurolyticum]VEU59119.1 restriction modification enzyme subunit S2B [Mesomycoplasma neurolyticum]VEU59857.1 restriction modification enzyme subunit S2B [Mesomycoplasma neurolyticum]
MFVSRFLKLFKTFSNGSIIDIIEPLEKQLNLIKNQINLFKKQQNLYSKKLLSNFEGIYKLSKLVEFLKGKNIKQSETLKDGKFNVYSSKTKDNGIFGKLNTFIFDGEYILITSHGAYAGTVIYVNEKFSTTSNCFVLKPDNSIVNTKFLFYLLKMKQPDLNTIAKGSAQGFLSNNDLSYFDINIPSLETQNLLISIIEPLYKKIELLEQKEKILIKRFNYYKNILIKG